MNTIPREKLLGTLKWRYATKQFDPAKKIAPADWSALEESLILSPSSFGLQPWKFVVVTDPQVREKLKAVSWNQGQVTDCSHHVVFAIRTDVNEAYIDRFLARAVEIRGGSVEPLAGYRGMMVSFANKAAKEGWLHEWATRQVYIALGNFMTSAALLGIDTCPMEGLEPAKYDEILGLNALGLKTVVACCAGYRSAQDKYAATPKVRFHPKDVILHV
ncbi:MAG: NAD(P)H-dependent oxidoreductase [Methylacidiphilales bacterium]|nr:NAD(P)H-dependent oxidoreductase [Candidatus Methylacidiphilales bacterium]